MNTDTTSANRELDGTATADPRSRRRLDSFRKILGDARSSLGLDFGFQLWDGSTVPADWPAGQMRVVVADEGVIASLVRRPTLDTVIGLHVSGRLVVENGTLFDIAKKRPDGKIGRVLRKLGIVRLLRTGLQFWRAPKGPQGFSTRSRKMPTHDPERRQSTSATSPTTTTSPTPSISSSSMTTWSTPVPTSNRTGTRILPKPSATSST